MPTVPMLDPEQAASQKGLLADDSTPGASQILQSAAVMHGMGRLLDSGQGQYSGTVGFRSPRRSKGFSERGSRRRG